MNKSPYYASNYDVIIIGGALSGMAAALQLAKDGNRVLILERHNLPGGVATSFVRNGVEMEASLHEMMGIGPKEDPMFVREFLESVGIDLNWLRVPEAYRLSSPGDSINIVLHAGKDSNGDYIASKEIEEAYPGDGEKVNRLFKLCEEVYASGFYLNDHHLSKLRILMEHTNLAKTAGYSAKEVLDAFGLSEPVKKILSSYWVYVGAKMDDLPFIVYACLIGDYMHGGAYVLRGFSHELSCAMAKKCIEMGVQIEYGQAVEKVLIRDEKRKDKLPSVYGVRTKRGDEIYAPYVISGPYPETVYKKMAEPIGLLPSKAFKLVNARKMSVSAFSLVLQLDEEPGKLNIKEYSVFSCDKPFDSNRFWKEGESLGGWDYVTTICMNYANPDCCPKGMTCLSITAMPLAEAFIGVDPDHYHEVKRKLAKEMIETISKRIGVNLFDHLVDLEIESPITVSRYTHQYRGGIYGYRHSMSDSVVTRLDTYFKEHYIHGLAWAGAHGLVGDGMACVIHIGEIAADVVRRWQKEDKGGVKQ